MFRRKEPSKFAEGRAEAAERLGKEEVERWEREHAKNWRIRPVPARQRPIADRVRALCARRPEIRAATMAETRGDTRDAVRLLIGIQLESAVKGRFEDYRRELLRMLKAEFPDAPEIEVEDLSGGGEIGPSEYRVHP